MMEEPIQGTCSKASEFASDKDIISSMPENVITNIMDQLEIEEAVRTSILSRGWRLKWTLLTQLVFDSKFFERLSYFDEESYYGRIIISRLLLQLKGGLTKFFLDVTEECYYEDINSWVMFLSRKGIEDFTLLSWHDIPLTLPTDFFSCLKLKRLELRNCCIRSIPGFSGFPNLLSLTMWSVSFESYQCGEFLTQSPLLEVLKIFHDSLTGLIQHVDLAKLENLKVLSLPLCKIDSMAMITSSSIVQLMGEFSKLQELTLNFLDCKAARKMDVVPPHVFCSSEVDYNRLGQLQLREVMLDRIGGWENETCLIKSLLSSSPFLKYIWIFARRSSHGPSYNEKEMMFGTRLLKLHQASPLAEISLRWTI